MMLSLLILYTACIYGHCYLICLVFIATLYTVFYSYWHCHISFPSLYDAMLLLTTGFILIAANLTGCISLSMAITSQLHIGPTYQLLLYVMHYEDLLLLHIISLGLLALLFFEVWQKIWRKLGAVNSLIPRAAE